MFCVNFRCRENNAANPENMTTYQYKTELWKLHVDFWLSAGGVGYLEEYCKITMMMLMVCVYVYAFFFVAELIGLLLSKLLIPYKYW